MSEMTERVAKAICGVRRGYGCYAKPFQPYGQIQETSIRTCGCGFWEDNDRMARAAIEAMREPTGPMVRDGNGHTHCGGPCGNASGADCWRAMIDAALK
jgi:hypothetical protein